MTKREMYTALRALAVAANRTDLVAGVDHEVELLNKKNSADRAPTANQIENQAIKSFVKANMVAGKQYTVTDFIKQVLAGSDYENVTTSRMTAIFTQMLDEANPAIKREVVKRKAMYSLVDAD